MSSLEQENLIREEWSQTKFAKEYFIVASSIADWWLKKLSDQKKEIVEKLKADESEIGDMLYNWDAYPGSDKQAKEVVEFFITSINKE